MSPRDIRDGGTRINLPPPTPTTTTRGGLSSFKTKQESSSKNKFGIIPQAGCCTRPPQGLPRPMPTPTSLIVSPQPSPMHVGRFASTLTGSWYPCHRCGSDLREPRTLWLSGPIYRPITLFSVLHCTDIISYVVLYAYYIYRDHAIPNGSSPARRQGWGPGGQSQKVSVPSISGV